MSNGKASGITCPACGASYRWKPELAGKKVKCRCGGVVVVPAQMPAEAATTARAEAKPSAPAPAKAAAPGESAVDPTPAAVDPKARQKLAGGAALVMVVALALMFVWSEPVRYRFFKGSPKVIDTATQIASLSDGDHVEIRLPLEDEFEVFAKEIGGDNYALIKVKDTKGQLRVCIAEPSQQPHDQLPKPLIGRIVTHGSKKTGWTLVSGFAAFPIPTNTRLLDPNDQPMSTVIFHLVLMAAALAVAIACALKLPGLLRKPPQDEAQN